MKQMWLVRHAETAANEAGILETRSSGTELTDRGIAQVHDLSSWFAQRPVGVVATSEAQRSIATGRVIGAAVDVQVINRAALNEFPAGELEGASGPSLDVYMDRLFSMTRDGGADESPRVAVGVHSMALHSFDAELRRLWRDFDNPVVVSHGAIMRLWVSTHLKHCVEVSKVRTSQFPNAGVLEVGLGGSGRWTTRQDWPPQSPAT